jgi:hypothetical protein
MMIRCALSWVLYYLGAAVCKVMLLIGRGYPLYNWLMIKSVDIQGRGDGPWSRDEKIF